jgi:DNA-binding CsgD family transcriptional regulator
VAEFVGRASELELVAGLADALRAGIGGAVLVEGEPGIGKSALLRAGLAGAADAEPGDASLGAASAGDAGPAVAGRPAAVYWGAADELGRQFPLSLMSEVLGLRLADGFPAGGGTAGGGVFAGSPVLGGVERLLEAVDRRCSRSPVVVVVEDLQWADEASVLVWHRLSRLAGQLPLLLAGSCHAGTGREDLELLRQSLITRGLPVIALGPMPDAEADRLAASLVGGRPGPQLAGLLRPAGGNPLYVRELADGLVHADRVRVSDGIAEVDGGPLPVPASLAAAVAGRLGRLPAEDFAVLRWAAVLGLEFSITDLGAVTGRPAAELIPVIQAAQEAGVVAGAGSRPAFRHGICRQVLYEGVPAALRRALHLQAAQALAQAGAAPERVAAQLAAAPGPADGWALDWLREAAPALVFRAPQAAADLLTAALERLPEGTEARDDLEARLVSAAYQLGRHDEVRERGQRLMAWTAPELAAEMAWLVAYSMWQGGQFAEGAAVARRALARPGASRPVTARLQAVVAISLANRGQLPEAAAAASQALVTAADDPLAAGYALNVLSLIDLLQGDHAARQLHIERALAVIGAEPQAADLRLLLLSNSVFSLIFAERQEQALATARQGLVLAEQISTPRLRMFRLAIGLLSYEAGRWDDAATELEAAADLPGPGHFAIAFRGMLALIAGHRDDQDAEREHLEAVRDTQFDTGLAWANGSALVAARAQAAERAGHRRAAIDVLAPCLEERFGQPMPGRYDLLPILTRLALAEGDSATAATAAALAAADAAQAPSMRRVQCAAEQCQALLTGDPAPAAAVAAYHGAAARPMDQAVALEDAAALAAAAGDLAAARRGLSAASALYAALGARWHLRRAADRLRPYGVRRGRGAGQARPASGWAALTPTEAAVARQVAAGQSNSDIAAVLALSRSTVQAHVAHILAKLGVRSRAEVRPGR